MSNDFAEYYGDINGYVTVSNLLNYKFFILKTATYQITVNVITNNASNIIYTNYLATNVISNTITNRYFINSNVSTNFGDYLLGTNNAIVYVCTNMIVHNNNIYYYGSNSLRYSLSSSGLSFHDNGRVSNGQLNDIQEIGGLSYRGSISFHTNDLVSDGTLSMRQAVSNINFNSNRISFYDNGQIKSGYIYEATVIGSTTYQPNFYQPDSGDSPRDREEFISFYPTGIVKRGRVGLQTVSNMPAIGIISFYPSGQISAADLGDDNFTIRGIPYRNNIAFYPDGQVSRGILGRRHTMIDGHPYASGLMISFHTNGRLASGTLSSNRMISGANIRGAFGPVHFYDNGQLKEGQSAGTQTVQSRSYTKGDAIRFDRDGNIQP